MTKSKSKTKPAKGGFKGSSRPRRSLTVAAAKSLGYLSENITAADADSGLDVTLAGLFRYKKYAPLKAAFERGQFLRNLEAEAGSSPNISRAARHLGFKSGQDLRNLLDGDTEAINVWSQARLALEIEQNKRVFDLAAQGSKWCIQLVEKFLTTDEEGIRPAGADLTRLIQKEIADLFDVTRITVNDWTNKQRCPRNADGTYNLYEVIRWYGDYERGKTTGKMPTADEMREIKIVRLRREEAQARGDLLERDSVVAGFCQRFERIVASCKHKAREIAIMAHGQTVDAIEKLIAHHHEDIQRQWCDVPEQLQLSPAAEEKLTECLEIISAEGR